MIITWLDKKSHVIFIFMEIPVILKKEFSSLLPEQIFILEKMCSLGTIEINTFIELFNINKSNSSLVQSLVDSGFLIKISSDQKTGSYLFPLDLISRYEDWKKERKIIHINEHRITITPCLSPKKIIKAKMPILTDIAFFADLCITSRVSLNRKGGPLKSFKKKLTSGFKKFAEYMGNENQALLSKIILDIAIECSAIKIEEPDKNSKRYLQTSVENPFSHIAPKALIPSIDKKLCRVILNLLSPENSDWICPVLERILWELPEQMWIDLNFLNLHFLEKFSTQKNISDKKYATKDPIDSSKNKKNFLLKTVRKAAVLLIYMRGFADLGIDTNNNITSVKLHKNIKTVSETISCESTSRPLFLDLDHNQLKNSIIRISPFSSYQLLRDIAEIAVEHKGPESNKAEFLFMSLDHRRCKKSFNLGITGPKIIKKIEKCHSFSFPENFRQAILNWWNEHGEVQILTADIIMARDIKTMERVKQKKDISNCLLKDVSPECAIIGKNKKKRALKILGSDDFMLKFMNISEMSHTVDRDDMKALLWAINAVQEACGEHENIYSTRIEKLGKRFSKILNAKENKRIRLESRESLFYMKKNLKLLEDDKIAAFNEQSLSPEKAGFAKVNPLLKEALSHDIPMRITYLDPNENQRIARDIHGPYKIVKQGKFFYLKAYADIFKDRFTIRLNNIISIILE